MSKKTTISVIIPYFNADKYIEETLQSLFNQTILPDEVIIVNDGSTSDEALNKLNDIQKQYSVEVFHKNNGGISSALNYGAKRADGDIIFQLDADDIILPNYLESFMNVFEKKENIDGVTCGYKMFYDGVDINNEGNFHRQYMPEGLLQPKIFFENCAGGSNSAFRKEVLDRIGYWDESFTSFQDWGMWLKFVQYNLKQYIILEYLYLYRVHKSSDLQRKDIMKKIQNQLAKYKCKTEHKTCTKSLEQYELDKKTFYNTQKIKPKNDRKIQNDFSFHRLKQLYREFILCVGREGVKNSIKRAKNYIKYGVGKK